MDFKNRMGITGASGFLGSYLCDRLPFPQKRLSRRMQTSRFPDCEWLIGDIESSADVESFVKDTPTLIHLACRGYPSRSENHNFIHDIHHNLLPTIQLFEAFAKANPDGHLIFSSTGGNMYDSSHPESLQTEETAPCPQSNYSIHKLAEEQYLRLLCKKYGIRATILRISNPYGILLPKDRGQGIIGVALNKILSQESLTIFDSLDSVRDYIHLDDVANAFRLVLEKPPLPKECRLFHVSSGVGYSLKAVLTLIEQQTQCSLKRIVHPSIPQPSYSVLSYQKIYSALGWNPQIDLEKGIEWMVQKSPHNTMANFNG